MASLDRMDLERIEGILSAFIADGGDYECRLYDRVILETISMMKNAMSKNDEIITDGTVVKVESLPYPADIDFFSDSEDWAEEFDYLL